MSAVIDYTTEVDLTTLFDQPFIDEVTKYLGLDPNVPTNHQPVNIHSMIHQSLRMLETEQWRVILPKEVILHLPREAFCYPDNRIYLPFGEVSTITSLTYIDTAEVLTDITSRVGDDIYLYTRPTGFLYSDIWNTFLVHTKLPEPITIAYTPGYTSPSEVPPGVKNALKLMVYEDFEQRGNEGLTEYSDACKHHQRQGWLRHPRLLEVI